MKQRAIFLFNTEAIQKSATGIVNHLLALFAAAPACERIKINRRVDFLRWALGFIYFWFGVLKFFPKLSSAEQLAGMTIELMSLGYITPNISLPLLGLWETAIGLALLTGKLQRLAIISLYFHVAGTLAPLVLLPDHTWSAPPIAASLEGQYIFKNLVTVAAALVISASKGCRK